MTSAALYAGTHYGEHAARSRFHSRSFLALARWIASSDSKHSDIRSGGLGIHQGHDAHRWHAISGRRHRLHVLDIRTAAPFFDGDASDKFETYRLGLQHQFTDDIMVYAAYATGSQRADLRPDDGFNLNRQLAGPVVARDIHELRDRRAYAVLRRRLHGEPSFFDVHYDDSRRQGIEFLP